MIEAKQGVKEIFEESTVTITADITNASSVLTNISSGDIANLEVGMKVVNSNLADRSKIISIGVDNVTLNRNALGSDSGASVYAGRGLDICFKEVESYYGITLDSWLYLDTIEGRMQQYPAIEIVGDEISTDYLEDESPDTVAWDTVALNIWIIHTGNDVRTVNDWILYCREAIKRLVDLDNTFNDKFNRVRLTNADLSDMFQLKERQDFLQFLVQGIDVRQIALY